MVQESLLQNMCDVTVEGGNAEMLKQEWGKEIGMDYSKFRWCGDFLLNVRQTTKKLMFDFILFPYLYKMLSKKIAWIILSQISDIRKIRAGSYYCTVMLTISQQHYLLSLTE